MHQIGLEYCLEIDELILLYRGLLWQNDQLGSFSITAKMSHLWVMA